MKKIVLSLAGALAATAFAPEAAAIPSYARQVGMACQACHLQHFPILNSFGRAFKAAGYTMMGAQGKIEGEHLSIPDTLNASMLVKVRYQKQNGTSGQTALLPDNPNTLADGQLQFGEELALFFGGRIAENIGFFFEGNAAAGNAANGLLATIRMPVVFDMGGAKLSVVPFTTDANGVQIGYELSSGGVQRTNRYAAQRRTTSAVQYNAEQGPDGGAATGFAFVAQNDMGFINLTKWAPSFAMGGNQAAVASHDMSSTYVRVAATPTVGDWALLGGFGVMSGTSVTGGAPAVSATSWTAAVAAGAGARIETKQTFLDLQAHGLVDGKELGIYAQYAKAPVTVNGNAYNSGIIGFRTTAAGGGVQALAATDIAPSDRKAWTIGADYSVIPHVLSLGAAYRHADTGAAISAANAALGRGKINNAVTLMAVYDLTQNVAVHVNYISYSGSDTVGGVRTKNDTLFELEAAF